MGTAKAAVSALVVTRVAAPKALVLIEDSDGGEMPLLVAGRLVAASPTCIAIGCASAERIEVTVGGLGLTRASAAEPAYDGRLATPSRKVAVRTVAGATLMEVTVPTTETRVLVSANASTEPTALTIAVERAGSGIAR
jgi:hypothetical protein